MRYRDAKELHNGDQVKRKKDGAFLIVKSVEAFGQYKIVHIHCVDDNNAAALLYNDEVE